MKNHHHNGSSRYGYFRSTHYPRCNRDGCNRDGSLAIYTRTGVRPRRVDSAMSFTVFGCGQHHVYSNPYSYYDWNYFTAHTLSALWDLVENYFSSGQTQGGCSTSRRAARNGDHLSQVTIDCTLLPALPAKSCRTTISTL